jgi:hypothetical protein
MKIFLSILIILISGFSIAHAQEIVTRGSVSGTRYSNVAYKSGSNLSAYEIERCKLDIYIPRTAGTAPFPVIVYFYGGGLNSGDKSEGWADWSNNFGYKFLEAGVAMVMVNYRLSGQQGTKWPAYIQDAAASVAWVSNNISVYGGDPNKVFVMGFSAGAYLTHMLSIDPKWYSDINFDRSKIKGYIPISGQTRAHGTVATDLGISQDQLMTLRPDAMPLGHVAKTEKPIHIFVGEYEGQTITDNYNYYNQLLNKGSTDLFIYTNPGKDHGGMRDGLGDATSPTRTKILDFVRIYSSCSAVNVPGTLQGESYCNGSGVSTEPTTDTGGGRNLSSIETNDWAAYKVNVPTTGTYAVQYRVASLNGGGSIRLEKVGGGTVFGTITVPKTSGWQSWTTISHNIQLDAGTQDIALVSAVGGFNVNWISFSNGCSSVPAQPGTITGNTSVASGSSQTYSVAAVSGATSYTWTLPSGWSGSSTSASITTSAGTVGGNISVKANNACGASTARTLAVTVTVSNPNIAYNKSVSVTSIQGTGYEGTKAVDANGSTRWASASTNNQNFVVDLGATYNINRVRISWEAAYARDYQIQVSTNNSTWTTIKEFWGKSSATADDYSGLNANARWIKVYCINRATTYGFSIYEFEAYGSYISARQSLEVGAEQLNEKQPTLFPNPATDEVTIRIPSFFVNGKISLSNIEGQKLIDESINGDEHTFNIGNLSSGFYIIHLGNSSQHKSLKLFKR